MKNKFSVCVFTEYSNNDVVDVYTFDTELPTKHIAQVGAYMMMRSIKTNGFDRGKVGIVNLSYHSKDGCKHYLYQFSQRKDGFVEFIKPSGFRQLYNKNTEIWKNLVKSGFEFCMDKGIIF